MPVQGQQLSVIREKGGISERVLQENKAREIFRKTNISYPLVRTRARTHQGVRNARFLENLASFFSSNTRFEILPFTLLPT